MGASGSGKTTLLNLIATIETPTNGTIEINGQDIVDLSEIDKAKFRREHLGFVFQEYDLLETLTIYENIALALTVKEIPKTRDVESSPAVLYKHGCNTMTADFLLLIRDSTEQLCRELLTQEELRELSGDIFMRDAGSPSI